MDYGYLISSVIYTLSFALISIILAFILAILLSVIVTRYTFIKKFIYIFAYISQSFPVIFMYPLFIILIGFSALSNILILIIISFFPIFICSMQSINSINNDLVIYYKNLFTKYAMIRHIYLPYSLTGAHRGLKISASYVAVSAVMIEWMAPYKGLGAYMAYAYRSYDMGRVLLCIFLIFVIMGFIILLPYFIKITMSKFNLMNLN